ADVRADGDVGDLESVGARRDHVQDPVVAGGTQVHAGVDAALHADGAAADVAGVGRAGDVDLQAGPGRQGDGLVLEGQHLATLGAADVEERRVARVRVDRPEDVTARAGRQVILQLDAGGVRTARVGDRDGEADRLAGRDAARVGRLHDLQVGGSLLVDG